MKKLLWGVPLGIIALVFSGFLMLLLFLIMAFAGIFGLNKDDMFDSQNQYEINLSELGENEIPKQFVEGYKKAGEKYGIPWTLLAAEHRVETNFGQDLNVSSAGALGHFQFMPLTWVGWGYGGGNRLGNANIPKKDLHNLSVISKYGGYGIDGNGDGKADPWEFEDSVYATAKYLSENGGKNGDLRGAVFQYNHAGWYVERVFHYYQAYSSKVKVVDTGGYGGAVSTSGKKGIEGAIAAGSTIINKSPYNWGGGRNETDIKNRSFDCSSFVRWAYSEAGINLGPISSTTTDTLVTKGKPVKPKDLKRGDLVFFKTYKQNGHVGIYLGNNEFLNDNSSNGVSIDRMDNPYWKDAFKGVARRVVE